MVVDNTAVVVVVAFVVLCNDEPDIVFNRRERQTNKLVVGCQRKQVRGCPFRFADSFRFNYNEMIF